MLPSRWWSTLTLLGFAGIISSAGAAEIPLFFAGYHSDCGVTIRHEPGELRISWPMAGQETGHIVLDLQAGRPLFRSIGIAAGAGATPQTLLESADPSVYLVVGTRQAPSGRPPDLSVFDVFFDTPANRPYSAFRSQLDPKRVRVTSQGRRASVSIGDLRIGPFEGELELTVYRGVPLVHVEAVVHTREDRRAILYDAGLAVTSPGAERFAWVDTEGMLERAEAASDAPDRPIKVRHRLLIAQTGAGSITCFPPPHQFFSPRDLTENLSTVWYGRGHRGLEERFGFGIRQSERGGGSFVPWFNAPPGARERLGVFYQLSSGDAERALREALRFTGGDRFPKLPGFHTFTSHWHMATAVAAMQENARGGLRSTPDFVRMFKDMGVEMVHLAEFHGDGHPQDPGPVRLAELEAMFDECRRQSDRELLLIPGEEANSHLGLPRPGRHPGHWMYLFPKAVYWTMKRAPGQPFFEELSPYGRVYHAGDRADMLNLLEREGGLAWSSHPRIKASSWTPDVFRHEDFYLSDHWLGGAWKAMPADLSHDRLGRRVLDLLDDMANWGQKKYVLGEVDVFKIDHTHELYGHMNINYLQLEPDRLPRFEEGWQPVLRALREGRFFVTTGEVLIPEFTLGGKPSGSSLALAPGDRPELRIKVRGTFPLQFVEIISGDGSHVHRTRLDCADSGAFEERTLNLKPDLVGRKWVRIEAWDVAANGAFSQPVWLSWSAAARRPRSRLSGAGSPRR
jgi:hypothetical protein